jgi:hypothetical protein
MPCVAANGSGASLEGKPEGCLDAAREGICSKGADGMCVARKAVDAAAEAAAEEAAEVAGFEAACRARTEPVREPVVAALQECEALAAAAAVFADYASRADQPQPLPGECVGSRPWMADQPQCLE